MLKKLSQAEIKELLGVEFKWKDGRQSKGTGPAGTKVEILTLEDGRVGNVLIRTHYLVAVQSEGPISRQILATVAKVFRAHGFTESDLEAGILQEMLAVLEGKKSKGSREFLGVTYQALESLDTIQIKLTYGPDGVPKVHKKALSCERAETDRS